MVQLRLDDFTGEDKPICHKCFGEEIRKSMCLDKLEDIEDIIEVRIDTIVSISTSFLIGLFLPSVRKYETKGVFFKKYKFYCDEYINHDIEDGIDECLKWIYDLHK